MTDFFFTLGDYRDFLSSALWIAGALVLILIIVGVWATLKR